MTLDQSRSAGLCFAGELGCQERQGDGWLESVSPMNPVSYLFASSHPILVVWPDGEIVTVRDGVMYGVVMTR